MPRRCWLIAGILSKFSADQQAYPQLRKTFWFISLSARSFSFHRPWLPFDVVEVPEYGGDLNAIHEAAPTLATVVKLHTASFQIAAFNSAYVSPLAKMRFVAGALRRGQIPRPFWKQKDTKDDVERKTTLLADEVTSPSQALLNWTSEAWALDRAKTRVIPNVFEPSASLLSLSPERDSRTVCFVGRLEVRKGVLELAKAIPMVLARAPDARFVFVGRSLPHPSTGEPLDEVILKIAGPAAARSITFAGGVNSDQVSGYLAASAVAVFPSYWENFPYVCLEAMSAACAVIGSNAGGMAEIIDDNRTGILVAPRSPRQIAAAIIDLLNSPAKRAAMGTAARARVVERYSSEAIAPLQEASYRLGIHRAAERRLASRNVQAMNVAQAESRATGQPASPADIPL
jgi:glycogen(starch) synthase